VPATDGLSIFAGTIKKSCPKEIGACFYPKSLVRRPIRKQKELWPRSGARSSTVMQPSSFVFRGRIGGLQPEKKPHRPLPGAKSSISARRQRLALATPRPRPTQKLGVASGGAYIFAAGRDQLRAGIEKTVHWGALSGSFFGRILQ